MKGRNSLPGDAWVSMGDRVGVWVEDPLRMGYLWVNLSSFQAHSCWSRGLAFLQGAAGTQLSQTWRGLLLAHALNARPLMP